jgi:DNA-binding YbaB/EbfC family protein
MARGFKGGFPGGMAGGGNMQALMKQAQKMQEDLQKAQAESENFEESGSAGGGVVTVVANGKHQIVSMKISPEIVSKDDIDMLQDLIVAATNEALKKVSEKVQARIGSATGGFNIPGLF